MHCREVRDMGKGKKVGLKDTKKAWKDAKILKKVQPIVPRYEIVPEKTALIVLDMNYVCAHRDYGIGPRFETIGLPSKYFYDRIDSTVIPNIQKLLNFFRENELKVIYTTMGCEREDMSDLPETWRMAYPKIGYHKSRPGTKEFEIREEIKPQAGEPVILKKSSGAFATSNIHQVLQDIGVDTLVITGVESDCCLYNTAIEANDRGYKVIVIDDASTTLTETGHKILLYTYGALFFFNVKSTKEIIKEMKEALVPVEAGAE
jgi:nicotinamidase-related amidase